MQWSISGQLVGHSAGHTFILSVNEWDRFHIGANGTLRQVANQLLLSRGLSAAGGLAADLGVRSGE